MMITDSQINAMREIAEKRSRDRKLEQYRRVALGESIIIPDAIYPSEKGPAGIWPVTIPIRAMCKRVLEWNDVCT